MTSQGRARDILDHRKFLCRVKTISFGVDKKWRELGYNLRQRVKQAMILMT